MSEPSPQDKFGVKIMEATKKLILAAIIAAVLPSTASAATSLNNGYLVDSEGAIVKDGIGGCWHTISWTPALAVVGCDAVAARNEIMISPKVSEIQPAPIPVPQSAPAQSPVQAAISSKKFTFSEEDLFSFNESELRPKGKAKLDTLVHDLDGTKYGFIHVTGYTDRIGGAQYNLKLSMRRADEVKDYLVSKGISADRIKAEGKGETLPITNPADCKGKTSAEDITCLQPDRRTEVTVDGVKESEAN
jgi:OOP family OmpA-OmpF porin